MQRSRKSLNTETSRGDESPDSGDDLQSPVLRSPAQPSSPVRGRAGAKKEQDEVNRQVQTEMRQ